MPAAKPVILYDNALETATVTVTSEAAGHPRENAWDYRTFTQWRPTSTATQDIDIDCGAPRPVDSLACIGHDLGSQGATVEVFSDDNAGYGSPTSLGSLAVASDDPLYLELTPANERYYRIRVTGLAAACGIGHLALGAQLEMQVLPQDGYDVDAQRVVGRSFRSADGHFLGAAAPWIERQLRAEFRYLTDAWVQDRLKPFLAGHYLQLKPFFYRPDPLNLPARLYFLRAPDEVELRLPSEATYRHWTLHGIGLKETDE